MEPDACTAMCTETPNTRANSMLNAHSTLKAEQLVSLDDLNYRTSYYTKIFQLITLVCALTLLANSSVR